MRKQDSMIDDDLELQQIEAQQQLKHQQHLQVGYYIFCGNFQIYSTLLLEGHSGAVCHWSSTSIGELSATQAQNSSTACWEEN